MRAGSVASSRIMKAPLVCSILLSWVAAWPARGESIVPERFLANRYDRLRSQSPFQLATVEEMPTEAPKVDWAEGLYVGSVARLTDKGVEKDWVVLRNRSDVGTMIQLFGNEPNAEGYQIVKIEWSEDPRKTKVSIKRGEQFATIEPDQAAFGTGGASAGNPQGVPAPGYRGAPVPAPVPPGSGIRPPGQINRIPPIPRPNMAPGGIPQPQINPAASGTPGAPEPRRRIRVINSPP